MTSLLPLRCTPLLLLPSRRYVLELARYDPDYDLRDRARLLRHFILGSAASKVRARPWPALSPPHPPSTPHPLTPPPSPAAGPRR